MSTVSLAALIEALDRPCRDALEQAAVNCAARGGYEIAIDDYMECLLPLDDMRDILLQFERNPDTLRELVSKRLSAGRHTGRPTFSPLLYQLLQEAYLLTTLDLGREHISVGALVLALLRNPVRYALLPFYAELRDISADELLRLLQGLEEERRPDRAAAPAETPGTPWTSPRTRATARPIRCSPAVRKSAWSSTSWPAAAKTIPFWWATPAWAKPPWWKGWP